MRLVWLSAVLLPACFWWKPYKVAPSGATTGPSAPFCITNAECGPDEACLSGRCGGHVGTALAISLVRGNVSDALAPNGYWVDDSLTVVGLGFTGDTTAEIGVFEGDSPAVESVPVLSVTESELQIGPLPTSLTAAPTKYTVRLTDIRGGVVERAVSLQRGLTTTMSAGAGVVATTQGGTTTLSMAPRFAGALTLNGLGSVALQVAPGRMDAAGAKVHLPLARVYRGWHAAGAYVVNCPPGHQIVSGGCGCAGTGTNALNEKLSDTQWYCSCTAAPINTSASSCAATPVGAGCHAGLALCLAGDTSP